MGKKTDAYGTDLTNYTRDSLVQKNAIATACGEITRLWQIIPGLEQASNRAGPDPSAALRKAFQDLADAKQAKETAQLNLRKLLVPFETKTKDFEKYIIGKKKSINPFKSKNSLPTAEGALNLAKQNITADYLLLTQWGVRTGARIELTLLRGGPSVQLVQPIT